MKKILERVEDSSSVTGEYRSLYPPIPKAVKIEVTSRCDLKCFFCAVTYKKQPAGDINQKFLYPLLDELAEIGVQEVGLFWLGEPLLNRQLAEHIAYAKKAGIPYVFITTNGRLATPERIKPIFDAGLDSIKVSINSSNREQYKKVCGVDAFDQVLANLKQFKTIRGDRTKPAIYASSIYDPNNSRIFDELKVLAQDYVDQHYPIRLYGELPYEEHLGLPLAEIMSDFYVELRSLKDMMPCWSVFKLPHISFDGQLSACYCDHDERLYMADLNKVSFKEAWHAKTLVNLRQAHLDKVLKGHACEDCIAYKKD